MDIWSFLDENDEIDSLVELSRQTKISYPSVLDAVGILERSGYINLVGNREKKVIKTQKFFSTRVNMRNLYIAARKK